MVAHRPTPLNTHIHTSPFGDLAGKHRLVPVPVPIIPLNPTSPPSPPSLGSARHSLLVSNGALLSSPTMRSSRYKRQLGIVEFVSPTQHNNPTYINPTTQPQTPLSLPPQSTNSRTFTQCTL